MRKVFLLFMVLVSVGCLSQNKQILYNFTAVPQSLMTNPGADVSYKFYFGVPLLSGISVNAGSTSFSAYDLFADNGVNYNTKLRDVVHRSSRNDKLAFNEQIELFSGGFKLGDWLENKGYISFGMYQEFDFMMFMPKDIAILALEGNRDYLGKSFNLGDLSLRTEMLSVLHVGFHKNITEKLILGGRAKIYSSAFNASSTKNSGYVYTIPATNTVYEQVIYSDLQLNTSGISEYIAEGYEGDAVGDIRKKTLFGGDLGLGFDLGLTYYPKKNIQFTASILDVGFIKHSKDVETLTYRGYYKYEGINPNFTGANTSGSTYQQFVDAIPRDTIYSAYKTWRPIKINSSYQYSFNDSRGGADCNCTVSESEYRNAVGGQLFVMSTPRAPMMALTGYYRRNILDKLQMKATYTVDSYSFKNIGLGMSSRLGAFNVYLMADNLLEYKDLAKAHSLSFQFGFNFIFKETNSPY
ncbi:hypothetical protein SAMN05443667_108164 [Flavobacterium gillisiae]|uniref:DUF5723 domain-containing protein n=1 Tax=Flavobacterium gillisiae TaxID=150146 RepID=A0A1H4DX24_9FLAO|nr:DUF5723 family protein [Flavobacterium gillisiae]SEA77137.1 hypothetical protein SAMN05443667_108164 [Flavobacterium gillisiae]